MATELFSNYPKTPYTFEVNSQRINVVTNLMSRFIIEPQLKTNTAAYYWHSIKDSDTPESIADQIYGSPYRYWIILQFNDIIDTRNQWPMDYNTFVDYLNSKYKTEAQSSGVDGVRYSKNTIHSHYIRQYTKINTQEFYKDITIDLEMSLDQNFTGESSEFEDSGNIVIMRWEKFNKTIYDYEMELNESKRRIKILKPEFVSGIESSLRNLYQ